MKVPNDDAVATVNGYGSSAAARCEWDDAHLICRLTRFADVYGALRNHRDFSSRRLLRTDKQQSPGGGGASILITDDPPRHTALRSIVSSRFTSKAVELLRPWIVEAARRLTTSLKSGAMDAARVFAEPLPVMSIAYVLGLQAGDWQTLKQWSHALLKWNTGSATKQERQLAIAAHLHLAAALRQKRTDPTNDVITRLSEALNLTGGLSDSEARAYCVLLLTAGNETTTNLIANSLNVLLDRSPLWKAFREGEVPVSGIINETLRFDSPVQVVRRVVTRHTQLNGLEFEAGNIVELCLGAAHRDPNEFVCPDSFVVNRDFTGHVAFGRGVHFCLGASLAKLVAESALMEFARRFSLLRREAAATRLDSYVLSGFSSLPVVVAT